ncbi:MAG: hypothetical protein M1840_003627 [Geoglossum simile]|nr:MAG: hypothetical protein M1840_003627 [Geoglossum simile]
MRRLAQRASARAKEVTSRWGLSEETTPELIKLALYDFVFLCDDSGSMDQSDRKRLLLETLRSVALFATVLEPTGITIRFINHNTDDTFNKMADVDDITRKVTLVNFSGATKLGTELDRKIVQPMIIDKANKGILKKPIIVVIITDGEPNSEHERCIHNTIYNCKTSNAVKEYGDAAVVFLVCQIGDSEEATTFLRDLENDRSVGGMVYCSANRLDELSRRVERGGGGATYTARTDQHIRHREWIS